MAKSLDKFSNKKKFEKEDTESDESLEEFEDDDEDQEEEDDDDGSELEEETESEDDEDKEENKPKKSKKEEKITDLKSTIKEELSLMSFEERIKFQNKLGLKKLNQMISQDNTKETKTFKRLNKNRPQELSSKRPVSTFRNIFQAKKREVIDPRFNSAFGEYKPEFFRKRYGFINDMRQRDKELLVDQLKNETDSKKKEQMKTALTRLKQQIKTYEESEKKEEMKEKIKKQALEDAKEGKRPHFVNKSEQKILELAEKYKELKKSGKVEKFLAKKRKKQLGKDSRHLHKNSENLRFK